MERARAGDEVAFESLVKATYQDTFTLAVRLTGDVDDACDVVQETYLRAFKSIKRFRGEAAFTTWLYRITANCSARLTRQRQRHRSRTEPLEAAQAIRDHCGARDPDAVAARLTDRPRLIEALDSLPPGMRAVVTLRDVYGLPHKDIAVSLGITETAAKVRLHRARKILRESLFETAEGSQSSQDELLASSAENCAHETGQGKEDRLAV